MRGSGIRRASLSARVVTATMVSVGIVLLTSSLVLRGTVRRAVESWEAERLGSVAHHVAEMVARTGGGDVRTMVAAAGADYRSFGYRVEWLPDGVPGSGQGAVTVALAKAPGVVRVTATEPAFAALDRRLWLVHGLLGATTLGAVLGAVRLSIFWGLGRPLRRLRKQIRVMKKGPWGAPAAALGAREIAELATELEAVGHTLDRRISSWIAVERRAAYEAARLELRQRLVAPVRELNLLAGEAVARADGDGDGVRRLREVLHAADRILEVVSGHVTSHERRQAPSPPIPGLRAGEDDRPSRTPSRT